MDFQDTNIMETTCNSKPRGKIESVAFGWIDIDIYVLTSTLFEINWIFLFFFLLIKWMWAFCTRRMWMSLGKKCVLAEVIIHLIKELVIKAHHTSWNLMEVFFSGFVTFTGKQNIFRHWKTDTSRRGMVEHFKEDPWRVTAKWLTVLPWTSAEQ